MEFRVRGQPSEVKQGIEVSLVMQKNTQVCMKVIHVPTYTFKLFFFYNGNFSFHKKKERKKNYLCGTRSIIVNLFVILLVSVKLVK